MNNIPDELLSYDEVAKLLGHKPKTIMNWKSLGVFHPNEYVKFGTSKQSDIRFKKSAILARILNGKFIK